MFWCQSIRLSHQAEKKCFTLEELNHLYQIINLPPLSGRDGNTNEESAASWSMLVDRITDTNCERRNELVLFSIHAWSVFPGYFHSNSHNFHIIFP